VQGSYVINPYRYASAAGGSITRLGLTTISGTVPSSPYQVSESITIDSDTNFLLVMGYTERGIGYLNDVAISGGSSTDTLINNSRAGTTDSFSARYIANPETGSKTVVLTWDPAQSGYEYTFSIIQYSGINLTDPVNTTQDSVNNAGSRRTLCGNAAYEQSLSWEVAANETVGFVIVNEIGVADAGFVLCSGSDGSVIVNDTSATEISLGIAEYIETTGSAAEVILMTDTTSASDFSTWAAILLNGETSL